MVGAGAETARAVTVEWEPVDRLNSVLALQPGVVADPAYRACAGRTWPISSVMATNESAQGRFSAATPAGTLTIKAIRESVTVPAGRFDTFRVEGSGYEVKHGTIRRFTYWMAPERVREPSDEPAVVGLEFRQARQRCQLLQILA